MMAASGRAVSDCRGWRVFAGRTGVRIGPWGHLFDRIVNMIGARIVRFCKSARIRLQHSNFRTGKFHSEIFLPPSPCVLTVFDGFVRLCRLGLGRLPKRCASECRASGIRVGHRPVIGALFDGESSCSFGDCGSSHPTPHGISQGSPRCGQARQREQATGKRL